MQIANPPAHPHGSTTCAIWQSRFVTTRLPNSTIEGGSIYTHIHVHTQNHIHIHAYIHTYTYTHTSLNTYMHLYKLVDMFQRKHAHIKLDAIPVSQAQPSAANFMPVIQKKWKSSDAQQIQLTNSIVSLIATDLLPLSLVDSKQFRSLLHTAEPAFTMPSRKHLSTQLLPQ